MLDSENEDRTVVHFYSKKNVSNLWGITRDGLLMLMS